MDGRHSLSEPVQEMADPTKPPTPSAGNNPASPASPPSVSADSILTKHGSEKHDFAKFGALPPRPGAAPRGRPPKNGLPAQSSVPSAPVRVPPVAGGVAVATTADGLPRPPVDPVLVRKSVEVLVKGIDSLAVSVVTNKAAKILPHGEARLVGESVRCPAASVDMIATSVPLVMEKYGVTSEYMPEAVLLTGVTGWLAGVNAALKRIDFYIQEKEEREKVKVGPVETKPNAVAP